MLKTIDDVVELVRRLRVEGAFSVAVGDISINMYPEEGPVKVEAQIPPEEASDKDPLPGVKPEGPWRGYSQEELGF